MEVYVLVPVRRTFATAFFGVLSLVAALGSFLLSCYSVLFFILAVALGALGYFLFFSSNREFEYSYFDGEARFARITNKSRRKVLAIYPMEEVVQIAPAGDRSVYKYENNSGVKVKDYTSRIQGAPYYDMVINKEGETILIKFEPDEKYLNEVMKKYAQKVIRRPVQG